MDPLTNLDTLPWEQWRVKAANVDATGGITANDAALILQYSAKIIDTFNSKSGLRSSNSTNADVSIIQEDNYLVFSSKGGLIGLNVFVKGNLSLLGQPEILNQNMINAFNITPNNYSLGLASAYSLVDGTEFMRIPLCLLCRNTSIQCGQILFNKIRKTNNDLNILQYMNSY